MTLRLFTSNRLEILAEALADVLRTPLASVLDKEEIVVQSQGMKRWVSMQLAERHGICANCGFSFPNAFVYDLFRKTISGLPEFSPFDPKIMTWRIMEILPSCVTRPGFESLRIYLGDTLANLKRFQVSERIADTFDQYLLFRPEMIFRWESGKENHWQAVLWREMVKGSEVKHRAALGRAFLEAIEEPSTEMKGLPERVSVFGISALPRFHMRLLAGISRIREVNLFLMNPCREYWGDILSDREMKRTAARQGTQDLSVEELHLEKGNSLLASMGTLGRDFFDLVNEFECEEFPSFKDPGADNLLCCLQSDILNLREGQQGLDGKKTVAAHDTSVQIHSCHSPMREIEVLRDQLLDMFERDPGLLPKDILVMTPDIETYAPYIQRKFGFLEMDLDLVRRWVRETRIRWGIDGQSRAQLDLPELAENTWQAGLDRLMLGYAMPGQDESMFGGVLPYDDIEGSEASVLGRLLEFTELLFTHVTSLGQARSLDGWSRTLTGLLEGFFVPDEDTEREMQMIRCALNDLGNMSAYCGSVLDEEIDVNVIRWYLRHYLESEGFGFGFITGGVTFCAMLPMRSIPCKIICLVGMNGDAYPRQAKPLGFDLMARHPQPGDRSRRNDDRYLFLEAMLSARETLYISYVGQSIQENSLIPPSVLVSELMDYIERGFTIQGEKILEHIFTRHRLQAFSPAYFKENERLFSYSEENLQAAQCILKAREVPVPFISSGLTDPEEEWKMVDLADFCAFFGNPARFVLKRRLGIHLEERASILEEREAFDLKGLERYLLEENLVERRLAGGNLKDFLALVRASGRLPHGTPGDCMYEDLTRGVEHFVERTVPYIREISLEPLEVDLGISGFRLAGRIDAIYPERLLHYRYARVKPRDRLRIWIHHLALNSVIADGYPRTSVLAGLRPKGGETEWAAWEYSPVENSEEILGRLLQQYWAGLVRPLHFFPDSSWTYAYMILEKNKPGENALSSARKTWTGSEYNRGECEDPSYQRCFRNTDPLDSEFRRIAEEVFSPLIEHQREIG